MNFALCAVLFAAAGGGAFDFLHTMRGPEFLFVYAFWFAAVFVVVLALRKMGHDTPIVSGLGLVAFELLGVTRYLVGSAHGMHRWDMLWMMMFVGGCCFVFRAESFNGSGRSGGSCGGGFSISSCSGGGGCGGGGGGCGGCGGS